MTPHQLYQEKRRTVEQALSLIHSGDTVIGDVHLGDWGLQMGLVIEGLRERQPELPYFDENARPAPSVQDSRSDIPPKRADSGSRALRPPPPHGITA